MRASHQHKQVLFAVDSRALIDVASLAAMIFKRFSRSFSTLPVKLTFDDMGNFYT